MADTRHVAVSTRATRGAGPASGRFGQPQNQVAAARRLVADLMRALEQRQRGLQGGLDGDPAADIAARALLAQLIEAIPPDGQAVSPRRAA
jgi:hypothetical protein